MHLPDRGSFGLQHASWHLPAVINSSPIQCSVSGGPLFRLLDGLNVMIPDEPTSEYEPPLVSAASARTRSAVMAVRGLETVRAKA